MKIALACHHRAFYMNKNIKAHLTEKGYEVKDFGCFDKSSCDYPDFAAPAAKAVASGECDMGVLTCTTGIRCALLGDLMSARLTREHNDTNMMAIGAGVTGEMLALEIVDTWLGTEFSHAERHQRRTPEAAGRRQFQRLPGPNRTDHQDNPAAAGRIETDPFQRRRNFSAHFPQARQKHPVEEFENRRSGRMRAAFDDHTRRPVGTEQQRQNRLGNQQGAAGAADGKILLAANESVRREP